MPCMDTAWCIHCHYLTADSSDRQELVSVEATSELMHLWGDVSGYAALGCPLGVCVSGDDETCCLVSDPPALPSRLEPSFHYRR